MTTTELDLMLQTLSIDSSRPVRVVTASDFPTALIVAVGRERLDALPTLGVFERGTGYLDGCFHPSMMPSSGVVKAIDNHCRISLTFTVGNSDWEHIASQASVNGISRGAVVPRVLFTIFQRYRNDGANSPDTITWCHRWASNIPTNDRRLLYGCVMLGDKYDAIREIWSGTHRDLHLL